MTVGGAIGETGDVGKLAIGVAMGDGMGAGGGVKMESGLTGGKTGVALATGAVEAVGFMKSSHG